MRHPADILREGCDILDAVLVPAGFHFEHRDAGRSSGGQFAFGDLTLDETLHSIDLFAREVMPALRAH